MGVSLLVGTKSHEIGAASFFTSFFSTIFVRLENESWGSRFPAVMNELYQGDLPASRVADALKELATIQAELGAFPPDSIVWDYEFRDRRPPWGDDIAKAITSLAQYFVTSDGKDLFTVMRTALHVAEQRHLAVFVR